MLQSRKQQRLLKQQLRDRDPAAAFTLLLHSRTLGHERLAVSRYLKAAYLGSSGLEGLKDYVRTAARRFKPGELHDTAMRIARELRVESDPHTALGDLIGGQLPLILPYAGTEPRLSGPITYCGARVSLVGRIRIGARAWFGPRALVRGDGHEVRIGDDVRLGERSTVHISHELYPVEIGNRVTAGRNAVLHACTVEEDCVIEDDVVILDGAVVGAGVLIERGAVIYPRSRLEPGWVYAGCPAKPVRLASREELAERRQAIGRSIFEAVFAIGSHRPEAPSDSQASFVAASAEWRGRVDIGSRSSIFFGCRLDGHEAGIRIGDDCNIQDNADFDAAAGPIILGDRVTIGHNADLAACFIGDRSLIGIGARLAPGSAVEPDVLLAAGATTLPGQRLEGGWLWAGRPARPIARLDSARRRMIATTIDHYAGYADMLSVSQAKALGLGSRVEAEAAIFEEEFG